MVSGIVSLLVVCALLLPTKIDQNWYHILVLAWLAVAGGNLVAWCTEIWPEDAYAAGVPIVLILLATIASLGGIEKAGRCVVVLAWIVGLLFAGILGAGLADLRWEMTQPRIGEAMPNGAFLFLLPAVPGMIGNRKSKSAIWAPISVVLLTTVIVIWTSMMLPDSMMSALQWPFYEACKNLRLFGSVERFEAFASAAVSMGYFSVFTYLLSAIRENVGEINEKYAKTGVITGSAIIVGIGLLLGKIDDMCLMIGGAVLLFLAPALWNLKNIVKK